jgi:GWxTD domain-containing protein
MVFSAPAWRVVAVDLADALTTIHFGEARMMSTSRETLALPALRVGRWAVPVLMMLLLAARPATAEKLTGEDEQWLSEVKVLMLADEEKVFRDLAAEERAEFRDLFWARRNPNGPAAKTNPARDEFEKVRADASHRFGRHGMDSDCARMLLLLGEPDTERPVAGPVGVGGGQASSGRGELAARPSGDYPAGMTHGDETRDVIVRQWTYHRLKGLRLTSGDLVLGFDESCHMNDGARRAIGSSLQPTYARARVVNPSIEIRLDETKRLVPLMRQLPQPGPVQTLLRSPRQDFPIADELVFMRSAPGSAAVLGMLQGRLEGAAPATPLKMTLRAEVVSPQGDVLSYTEREVTVRPTANGSFEAAFGLPSQPGTFTLRAGIVEPGSQRGAVVSHAVDVPDFAVKGLTSSTLMFLETIAPVTETADDEPLAPFVMGSYRLVPRFGRSFDRKETLTLVCNYYGGQADAATGKATVTGSLGILKNGELVAKRVEQTLDVVNGALVYGPLPLAALSPGRYEAEFLITDASSKQETKARGTFEIKP